MFSTQRKGQSMDTINSLKRSLVISGAALVIAVPAAQAHTSGLPAQLATGPQQPSQTAAARVGVNHVPVHLATGPQQPSQTAAARVGVNHVPVHLANVRAARVAFVASPTPPATAGTESVRFSHGALRSSHPVVTGTDQGTQWANLAFGGLAVAIVFSVMYLAIAGTQLPRIPRRPGTQVPGHPATRRKHEEASQLQWPLVTQMPSGS